MVNRQKARRVAIVAHVGAAKGHLLRAIAIQNSLDEGVESLLVVPEKSKTFLHTFFPNVSCRFVDWLFSHNNLFDQSLSEVVEHLRRTITDLELIFESFVPDLVVGIPGFQTSSICRALGVPHVSVLHGPWLVPEYSFTDLSDEEKAVLTSWDRSVELTDILANIISSALGAPYRGYRRWLEEEEVWVAQDFDVSYKTRRPVIGFLQTDFGPAADRELPKNCWSVCLGSAVEHATPTLLAALPKEGPPRVVVGGLPVKETEKVRWRQSLAATSLAKISSIAVTHAGIGTIPVFAGLQIPQIFVPHDLDQAINAILASRSGFGTSIDLRHWRRRSPFGRIKPPISVAQLAQRVRMAARTKPGRKTKTNNKSVVAALISGSIN